MRNQEKEEALLSNSVHVKVFYGKGVTLVLKNKTFEEIIVILFQSPAFSNYHPLKIVFVNTEKVLYADKAAFLLFLKKQIDLSELLEKTECEELYRNNTEIYTDNDFEVENGSLWKQKGNELILIDDDNFVTVQMNKNTFDLAV